MDRLSNWVDTRRNIFLLYVGALPRPFLESVFFSFFLFFSFSLFPFFTDDELMTNWWRTDDELMTNWWRADDELMTSWWRADDELMMSWCRPQREWVCEVRKVKSEKKKLSLFFEKCKVKKMLSLFFEKWKVKSKCFETEIKKWKFSRIPDKNEILQQNYSTRRRRWSTSKMTSPTWR